MAEEKTQIKESDAMYIQTQLGTGLSTQPQTSKIDIQAPLENINATESLHKLKAENTNLYQVINRLEEETLILKELFNKTNTELNNMRQPALLVAKITTVVGDKAVIRIPNGNEFFSYLSNEAKGLRSGDSVLVEQKSLNIIKKIEITDNLEVEKYIIIETPKENWKDIGGLADEIREVKEVIELPLKNPKLFEKVGINPPKGISF